MMKYQHRFVKKLLIFIAEISPNLIYLCILKAVWIMILRFMGDMEEPKNEEYFNEHEEKQSLNSPIMEKLVANLWKMNGHNNNNNNYNNNNNEKHNHRLIHKTLKRKTKLPQVLRNALNNSDEVRYYHQTLSCESTKLEKLHFIIGHAIMKPQLRFAS